MAVTQCQLSWALLATIGCSAVSFAGDDDDTNKDGDNDDDQAQELLAAIGCSAVSSDK